MQPKKEPNRSERKLRKKLNRRKKEGRAALHSKRRKREDFFLTMKWKREKKGREALHSKRRKREDFFGKERKREGKIRTQDRKKMEQKGRKNVVPGTWNLEPVPGREEERRKRGSIDISNSWFCSFVIEGKDGRREASVPGSAVSVVIPRSTWSEQRPPEMCAASAHPTRKCYTWKDRQPQEV